MIHRALTMIFTSAVLCGLIAPTALGGGPDIRPYYTSTLNELGVTYDVWDVATQGEPSANDLTGYRMIIWFTGYPRSDTFTSANEAAVATYLDAGGQFCLVSEDYLHDRGLTSFGRSRLRIGSYTSDVNRTDPVGYAGHSIGNGLGPYNLTAPAGWPGDLYTDTVNNAGGWGVSSPFRWNSTGQNNSTSYSCGTYQTVFLGWPLEGLANLANRTEVMEAIIAWFGGCSGPGANPTCVLLVDDDQTPTYYVYLPLVLKQERG